MKFKDIRQRVGFAVEKLKELYPDAKCSLYADNPFELLVATRLSAQCTDARVNQVTPKLFERYPDARAMANADIAELEEIIKSCGLYKTKARDLIEMSKILVERYDSTVPDTIEELIKLPGIGRKTANLIVGDIYGKPAVVADTHFIRLCNRLGFVDTKDPLKVEMRMRQLLPPEESNVFCHRMVHHGRQICTARAPKCEKCGLNIICLYKNNK